MMLGPAPKPFPGYPLTARLLRNLKDSATELKGCALAIGNFDGVHSGHAVLVNQLVAAAKKINGTPVVFTFDPHPLKILRPDIAPIPLCWTERKAELLGDLGIEVVVAYPTDMELLKLSPRDFFQSIIVEQIGAAAIVEGPNFCFGRDRAGDLKLLGELCNEFQIELQVVTPVGESPDKCGNLISSTRIREFIRNGEIESANRLLTEPYQIRGRVVSGARRGATIGFPTANLSEIDTLVPAHSVYAARTTIDGQQFAVALNIGPNPTFGENSTKVEAHVIDWSGDLYERTLELEILMKLRDVKKFANVNELISQLKTDIQTVKESVRID